MQREVIALDLETTGLDPTESGIIEVGLARCSGGDVIETYQTLVNPETPIPEKITGLTGITDEEVANAPIISDVLLPMRDFIGDRPILGHNVAFDVGMLRRYDIGQKNPHIDTYELASFLMPSAQRYTLTSLVHELNLTLDNAHRALDDALASWEVFRRLWDILLTVPVEILEEILPHARAVHWDGVAIVIEDAVKVGSSSGKRYQFSWESAPAADLIPAPTGEQKLIPTEELEKLLSSGGGLSDSLPNYQERETQLEMLRLVSAAFNDSENLMIEAPPGTGKSLAYLLPAARWAQDNHQPVILATNSIRLHEQLTMQDIPMMREHLSIDVRAASLMKPQYYLCPRRFEEFRLRVPTSIDDLRLLTKVMVWLHNQGSGMKRDINVRTSEEFAWQRICANDDTCGDNSCMAHTEGTCPFFRAKQAASRAHLVLVNHAMLLANETLLPPHTHVIIDEAHHLENALTYSNTLRLDRDSITRHIDEIRVGMLQDLLNTMQQHLAPEAYENLKAYTADIGKAMNQMKKHIRRIVDTVPTLTTEEEIGTSDTARELIRLTRSIRQKADWARILSHWDMLTEFTDVLTSALSKIIREIHALKTDSDTDANLQSLANTLRFAVDYLQTTYNQLKNIFINPDSNMVYWVEYRAPNAEDLSVFAAPLYVGSLLDQYVWSKNQSVILTSATLQNANTFSFIDDRLQTLNFDHIVLGSTFDYNANTLVYLPTDVPEPNKREEYQIMLERGIIELATLLEGRVLCLFTGYQHLRETAQSVAPRLALGGISVLDQTSGSSRQVLLDEFVRQEKAVLMGTKSFWEGVDIPGDDLSAVIISRLPFAVPSDPIFAARAESYSQDSFMQYSLPDAILRFRQGFGRLIRRRDDRGVVAIFDRRIITKRYGQHFLESLPDVNLQRGPVARLAHVTKQWLEL